MTPKTNVLFAICVGALSVAAGCGDGSAEGSAASLCAQMCGNVDDCPNVYWEGDCMADCEDALDAADFAGGACPAEFDELLGCQAQLSCGELSNRANGGFHNDACVAVEQRLLSCESRSPDDGNRDDQNPASSELELACEAACSAIDDCPNTAAEADCLDICVAGYRRAENGTAVCSDAIVDTVNCQAAMSCQEIENRVLGRTTYDVCREADRVAQVACQ